MIIARPLSYSLPTVAHDLPPLYRWLPFTPPSARDTGSPEEGKPGAWSGSQVVHMD